MKEYFPLMTEEYRQKHYPDGVFDRIRRNTATVSILVYLFMGVVFVGGGYLTVWCLKKLDDFRAADLFGFGIFMTVFCALFALIALACIIISVRRHLRGAETWKERCAKEGGYTVADMEEFERQALATDSRVLCLVDPAKKVLEGQEDGILTRDYIALLLNTPTILKLSDIGTACLVEQKVQMGKGTSRVGVPYLSIALLGKNGTRVIAECSKESGPALLALLKERVPDLDTADDAILDRADYDDLWTSRYSKPANV